MVDPGVCPPRARVELADVIRRFGPQYTCRYGHRMMPSQKRALSDIAACCTRELGGRLYRCDDCHDTFWRYHCCRNRACPKCHNTQAREWLEVRQAELLPCDYYHAVATVPSALRAAFRRNQKLMYGLLMQVSAAAVKDLCADKRHLGGLPGMLAVLHTWNGLWHPSKREQSNRAWLLLILATPAHTALRPRTSGLSEALSQLTELGDHASDEPADHDAALPRCPHCGSCRTRFIGEYPRFGVP